MRCGVYRNVCWRLPPLRPGVGTRQLGGKMVPAAGLRTVRRVGASPTRRQPADVRRTSGRGLNSRICRFANCRPNWPSNKAPVRRPPPMPIRPALRPPRLPAANPTGLPPGAAVVGSDLSGIVFFKDGEFLNFSTPNKDFTMHLGGWVQWDNVWWNQPPALKVAPDAQGRQPSPESLPATPAAASNNGTFGSLQDGDYWRRLRIVQEGTFWETGEYRFNWALENDQFSTVGLDEMWVGQNKIPVIGTVRVGHVKNAIGLEGDMTSSSRCMTFMERSSYSEAIELNQNFVTGLWFGSSYADDRVTYQAVAFRPDNANSGDFFGDGQSGVQARLTCLPLYEDEGRHLLHLGMSGGWRNGTNNLASTAATSATRLRCKPGPNCGTTIRPVPRRAARPSPNANSNRDDQHRGARVRQ